MTQHRLISLLESYQLGTLTEEEYTLLMNEIIKDESGEEVPDAMLSILNKNERSVNYNSERWNPVLQKVLAIDQQKNTHPPTVHRVHFLRRGFLKYAAAIIIILGTGTYLITKNNISPAEKIALHKPVIQKAEEKIVLTLSDGRQIIVNDSSANNIADGHTIIKKENGVLIYNTGLSTEKPIYNTMTTPKGGQYQLILPDGSKVWLNAASSLTYPIVFTGTKREVELTGEAYFEIKENKKYPFIVNALNTHIEVLGTGFNVNAYKNEAGVSTTLVNGAVKVFSQKNSVVIKPGQQINISYSNNQMTTTLPNIDDVLAWREGMFQFENRNIQTIMRQLERWYDVTVEYKGPLPDAEFSGSLSRTENASMLLDALSLTKKVHFIIDGKKIIVLAGPSDKK
jgi:transmembrane sensor